MSIFSNIFSSNPAPAPVTPAPAAAPVQTPPGNIPDPQVGTQVTPQTPPNGVVPAQPAAEPIKDDTPMADFATIWDTDPNAPKPAEAPKPLDPVALAKTMEGVNFNSAMSQENLEAVQAGGEGAVTAMQTMMNELGRQVLTQATLVNNKLTQTAVDNAVAQQQDKIPQLLRQEQAASHLTDTNSLYSNPAIAPVTEAVRSALLQKNPNATPAQITELTTNYMNEMGSMFAPQKPASNVEEGNTTDWETYLDPPANI